jgi:hypothetical protein
LIRRNYSIKFEELKEVIRKEKMVPKKDHKRRVYFKVMTESNYRKSICR